MDASQRRQLEARRAALIGESSRIEDAKAALARTAPSAASDARHMQLVRQQDAIVDQIYALDDQLRE